MNPYGGTEIQLEYLHKYVSKELLDKVQITTSIPEKTPLIIDKPNVLWVHNSYDQPNVMPWFKNKLNHGKYDWYVFNSHWTYEKFRYFFSIPTELCLVIKNGFDDDLILKTDFKTKEKIKPDGIKRSRMVNEGDFILSNSMSFGRPYIMKISGCIHDGWLVLKDKSGLFDQDYLYYYLGSNTTYKQFDLLASGSTVRNLNIDLVRGVKVTLPPIDEQ